MRIYDEIQPAVFGQPSFMQIKQDVHNTRYKGTIKTYSAEKGQGYLFCPGLKKDFIFFRNNLLVHRTPPKGTEVSFSILQKYGMDQAIKIMFQ